MTTEEPISLEQSIAYNLFADARAAFDMGHTGPCLDALRMLDEFITTKDHPLYHRALALAVAAILGGAESEGNLSEAELESLLTPLN